MSTVPSPRAVYLHIGCRKTGTSFLQNAVYTSAEAMAKQDVGLPVPNRRARQHLVPALRAIPDTGSVPTATAEVLFRLGRVCRRTPGTRLLITHEGLAALSPAQLTPLLDTLGEFTLHLVLTARDLARQIPSEWQQQVKERFEVPYDVFTRAVRSRGPAAELFWARQDVVAITERWGASLPPEQVHIVTVPPADAPPGQLLARFCSVLGCDPASMSAQRVRNPSLGVEQAELLRRVNVALGDRLTDVRGGYRSVIRTDLVRKVLLEQPGLPLELPPKLSAWCQAAAAGVVATLAARGYDIVGELGDLLPVPAARELRAPAVTEPAVTAAAVEALATWADLRYQEANRATPDTDGFPGDT